MTSINAVYFRIVSSEFNYHYYVHLTTFKFSMQYFRTSWSLCDYIANSVPLFTTRRSNRTSNGWLETYHVLRIYPSILLAKTLGYSTGFIPTFQRCIAGLYSN